MWVRFPSPASMSGWSLIETLFALIVMAILLATGAPVFINQVREHRLTLFVNELHSALTLARSEAVRSGRRVTLCTSADGEECSSEVDWDAGWILFQDPTATAQRNVEDAVLRHGQPAAANVSARGNSSLVDYVSYLPTGQSRTINGALQMGTIDVCSGSLRRRLIISTSGRARVQRSGSCPEG